MIYALLWLVAGGVVRRAAPAIDDDDMPGDVGKVSAIIIDLAEIVLWPVRLGFWLFLPAK